MARLQPLDYLSGNKQIRYPFKFGTTLKATSGYDLDDSFLLEGFLIYKSKTAKRAYLKTFENDTSAEVFRFTIEVLDAASSVVATELFQISFTDVVEMEQFTVSTTSFWGKFIPGPTLLGMKASTHTTSSYTIGATEFSPSAISLSMPSVTSTQFYNMDEDNEPELLVTLATSTLNLTEGTNVSFTESNGTVLEVIPSAGAGKHDPCSDIDEIRTINGFRSDTNQNFAIRGEACYTVNPHDTEPNTLYIDNVCDPSCSTEQINAFAYYLNRVSDGLSDIVGLATNVRSDVQDIIDEYYNVTLPYINSPAYSVKIVRTVTPNGCKRYTFAVAINNPTDSVFNFTVDLSFTGGLTANKGTYQVGSLIVDADPVDGFSGSLPCKSQGILTFTVYAYVDGTVTVAVNTARADGQIVFALEA